MGESDTLRNRQGRDAPTYHAADAALALCQGRWRAAFANPLVGFGFCDLDRRLLDSNAALEQLVGHTGDELRDAPVPFATHPDDREVNLATFRAVATGQQEQGDYTKRYVHRDGTIVWCHVFLALVRGPDNEPEQILVMLVDITAQVHDELALLAQQLGLSSTELAILPLLARPELKSYSQVGAQLARSGETVRKHAQHIAEKLGLPTAARAEIVRAAKERGLLDLAAPAPGGENG